ncbi:MAG: nicotinate-nucleotide adenylyltransferase [Desulfobulbaceae bacterium]|nr:nicotinate-nucleotide adenylyltransferase [Desulfobulbaceae bacterium]
MDLPKEMGRRVGVLGGTFDPVHNGHLALVEAAFAGLALDSLILIPAAVPPHKRDLIVTPLAHRLAMLRLAIAGRPGIYVSALESDRPGPSFSVDTLTALRGHLGADVTLFFLVGIDAFVEIQSWKEYQRLPLLAELVVVDRAGSAGERLDDAVLGRFVGYCKDVASGVWRGPADNGVIRSLGMKPVQVSSTDIRNLVASGQKVDHFLPEAVADYIYNQQLYSS